MLPPTEPLLRIVRAFTSAPLDINNSTFFKFPDRTASYIQGKMTESVPLNSGMGDYAYPQ
jgi:hypothetical protein